MKKRQISISLPEDIFQKIDEISKIMRWSRSRVVVEMLQNKNISFDEAYGTIVKMKDEYEALGYPFQKKD